MARRIDRLAIAAAVALTTALSAVAASAAPPAAAGGKETKVEYISGGVGSDERQALEQGSAGYNLRVEMAEPSGKFQGGGKVKIRDAAGRTMLDTSTKGPLLYAKLPPGRYTILVGEDGAAAKQRSVDVAASGRTNVVVDLDQE